MRERGELNQYFCITCTLMMLKFSCNTRGVVSRSRFVMSLSSTPGLSLKWRTQFCKISTLVCTGAHPSQGTWAFTTRGRRSKSSDPLAEQISGTHAVVRGGTQRKGSERRGMKRAINTQRREGGRERKKKG